MIDAKPWIEHLSEPLVLAGFGLFIFATLATVILKQRRIVSANAKLAVMMSFALALISVVGGVWLAGRKVESTQVRTSPPPALEQKPQAAQSPAPLPAQSSPSNVNQNTRGDQSPAINAGGDVHYVGKP